MSVYQKILGHPFVYDHIRPLATGGIDMSPLYRRLDAGPEAVILDVGCGTGDALRYIGTFARYLGVDTDDVAVSTARRRFGGRAGVAFECRIATREDIEAFAPSHVVLAGLLHHLPDAAALSLLEDVRRAPSVQRVVTQDIVYVKGRWISNTLARLDRGRFCRERAGYERLFDRAGLHLVESDLVRCHPDTGLAWYLMTTLEPR